ncbi:NADH-quinone oxidoreductase subunit C [Thermodesulfobacterium thermophilum]|uniref:NADH-quinone oxidoreductase subunit C n=1 Tax=Thermodesulfobacterium thermophilum TaxID=886 RepID=UPI000419F4C5|nr:NADH-quinone oxidoreductase subunit C [Thermodesulfobacterium thermophilum]
MALYEELKTKFPEVVKEGFQEVDGEVVVCNREGFLDLIAWLKQEKGFIHLIDLCGVDYLGYKPKTFEERFEVVYHVFNLDERKLLRLKVRVPEEDPWQYSITSLWKEANWFERECFDMFGIVFKGHPDLRRVLMPEDWKGYPLRKDYPLFSEEEDWEPYKVLVEKYKRRG